MEEKEEKKRCTEHGLKDGQGEAVRGEEKVKRGARIKAKEEWRKRREKYEKNSKREKVE